MVRGLDKRTSGDLIRLVIFMVTTALATGVLIVTIGNLSFGATKEYTADFVDATGVNKGDDIRIAGVKVGSVEDIDIIKGNRAKITFKVDADTKLDDATHATIRYRNLLGQRYISLAQDGSGGDRLEEGEGIPVDRTTPALDLTVLFNGFKPLFEALSPDDINKLSFEIVQVFQGEGGTLEGLLSSTASITQTLADRDKVIGELLENLDYVLDHVADRDKQLTNLIDSFRSLVGGLNDDREAILSSLDSISELSVQTAALVTDIKDPFVKDIKELRKVATTLNRNRKEIDRALQVLPVKLTKIGRTAIYGSWFNFYLCHFKTTIKVPGLKNPLGTTIPVDAPRCSLKKEVGE
ncbi:phospholipid/cholesterol/gamma-HCH transport system substrate-binding protein [Nocardioides aromaticivorans]|uniref:Phospholipid/cholesterol/gamma-HCH transport system substrate-binding protein n=1 Tax=Nocardioides aromaticivorans TaxID=200618 RepID=A0A7Y9ZHM4_9ACTN|nr:MlaD family protein [Nocardioides aromaticivorans]NYI45627.1 phospholipid/cholesterol/gamma-HCH transport system substrate-binding protein [Nocardioides aromaticivorans]